MKRLFSVNSNTQQDYDELKENMREVCPFYIVLMVLLGVFSVWGLVSVPSIRHPAQLFLYSALMLAHTVSHLMSHI